MLLLEYFTHVESDRTGLEELQQEQTSENKRQNRLDRQLRRLILWSLTQFFEGLTIGQDAGLRQLDVVRRRESVTVRTPVGRQLVVRGDRFLPLRDEAFDLGRFGGHG